MSLSYLHLDSSASQPTQGSDSVQLDAKAAPREALFASSLVAPGRAQEVAEQPLESRFRNGNPFPEGLGPGEWGVLLLHCPCEEGLILLLFCFLGPQRVL